jgi:hypothetical protein
MLAGLAAGDLTIPSSDQPTDHRYIHTVGPITLAPHRRAGIWVAVVSGRNAGEFFASVDVATADIARRQAGPPDVDEGQGGGAVRVRTTRASVPSVNPRCKRGCEAR